MHLNTEIQNTSVQADLAKKEWINDKVMSYDDSYKKDKAVENKELSEIKIKPLGLDCS